MQTELSRVIDSVCKDKGVERSAIIAAVEDAVVSAAQKLFKMDGKIKELEAHYNEEEGEIELFEFKTVVDSVEDPETEISIEDAKEHDPDVEEGDVIGVKISPEFTRIAIQNAKQKILQKLKEAEGKVIYEEFKNRKGELVSGIVRRIERNAIIVDIGRTEAILPHEHQVPKEYYKLKERIRAILIDIRETKRIPQLILSRAHPDFVRRLFEAEVPEIAEGIVEIKGIARDPGVRTKIAVASNDPDVDPVGACVGMKGSRVQNIIAELRGEKIDIVPWSADPARYVCNALSPAQVNKVIIDESNRAMEVIVDDDQLSLAIGRRGQNVRLASRLTDWRVDIKTESQMRKEQNEVISLLMTLPNVGEVMANILYNEGFRTLQDIAFADTKVLVKAAGLKDEEEAKKLQVAARIALRSKLEKMAVHEDEASPQYDNPAAQTTTPSAES
jgi:N utilization substance protein A